MSEAPSKSPYSIIPVTKQHTEQVIHFLRKFFFRDEPLNVAVALLEEPNTTCQELEEFCVACIPDGLSLAAVSQNGNLIGVCLNALVTRERLAEENTAHLIQNCSNEKFSKILTLLNTIKTQSNVFAHFPKADRILEIVIISVDEDCRGQGICKALVEKTKELAIENAMSLIKVDCSSHYSAKAVSRLGFHNIFTLNYEDYKDDNGSRIFNTAIPHTCAKTYVLPLNNV